MSFSIRARALHPIFPIVFAVWTGALGNTFPVLVQLEWFSIYSDQFLQNALVITPQIWCLIRWRLLLGGFRWVLAKANDKPLRLKSNFCLGTWFRATDRLIQWTERLVRATERVVRTTEQLVRSLPGWTSSTQKNSPSFDVWDLSVSPASVVATDVIKHFETF